MENQISPNSPVVAPSNNDQRLMGVGTLIGKAWEIFRAKFTVIIQIAAIGVVVQVLQVVLILTVVPFLAILGVVVGIANFFVSLWLGVSLVYMVKDRDEEISVKEVLSRGWKKILSYWWVSILSGLIVVGGFILFIVPGIIIATWFILAMYVLVSEDLRGMSALFRSKQLVSGYWWSVFGRFLVLGLVLLVTVIPFIILTAIIGGSGYFDIKGSENVELGPRLAIQSLTTLYQWGIAAIVAAFGFLLYEDLKRVKGNPVFEEPSSGTKRKYVALGILPLVLIPLIVLLVGLGSLWALFQTY